MKPSRDLFDLIRSLTKAEKRYVSLFLSTSLHGSNKTSLKLFKTIGKMETYDEALLKKQLGKPFTKRLSAEKNKLYELIMESMLFYYRESRVEKRAMRARYHFAFLFDKSLRPQAWKYFRKAAVITEEYEMLSLQTILAYAENIEARQSFDGEMDFSLDRYLEKNRRLTESLRDDLLLHTLYTALIDLENRYGNVPPGGKARAELEKIIQHPLMDPACELHVLTSQVTRAEIRALYFGITAQHRDAHDAYHELVLLMERSPTYMDRLYGLYCNALTCQLIHKILTREYSGVDKLSGKLRQAIQSIPKYIPADLAYIELFGVQQYELIMYKNLADTGKGAALLGQAEKSFVKYRAQMRDTLLMSFLFLFGAYHYYLGNLKKALAHFNDLTDTTGTDVVQNFQCMVRLVKLLLHYDLGHTDLLGSLAGSASRLLARHERLGAFEKQLLAFFRKSPDINDKAQLRALRDLIRRLAPGHYSYGAWCDFDFEAWAESRLSGKPLYEVIRRQSKLSG